MVDLLNEAQKLAVETTEGNLLILAGPGTGKTKTLVERVCYLLEEKNVEPRHITITTFTRKAARELISRLSHRVKSKDGLSIEGINAGNFNQLAQRILDYGFDYLPYRSFYKQMDENEQISFILDNFDDLYQKGGLAYFFDTMGNNQRFYTAKAIASWLNRLREGFVDLQARDEATLRARHAINYYQEKLVEHNLIDFSGVLWQTLLLLQHHDDVRKEFQDRCRYLMVDEYQDTNPIQEKLIELLSARHGNLCVVGDDDQSLYRFRGATVQNLLTFEERYTNTKRINLNINYRSDERILDLATTFLDYPYRDLEASRAETDKGKIGDFRFRKELTSHREETHQEAVQVIVGDDNDQIHKQIIDAVLMLKQNGLDYRQMVILSHSVKSDPMKALIRALRDQDVPIYAPKEGAILSFPEVKRLLAHYIFFFQEELNEVGGGDDFQAKTARNFLRELDNLPKTRLVERVEVASHLKTLTEEEGLDPVQIGLAFLRCQPFDKMVMEAIQGKKNNNLQLEHIATFLQLLRKFCQRKGTLRLKPSDLKAFSAAFFHDFIPFLEQARVEGDGNVEVSASDEDFLNILTIHQAKGLEFPVVFLMEPMKVNRYFNNRYDPLSNLTENPSLGHGMTGNLADDIDKARLYYTSFTRAKDILFLCGIDPLAAGSMAMGGKPNKEEVADEFKGINMTQVVYQPGKLNSAIDFRLNNEEKILGAYAYTTDIALYDKCPRKFYLMRKVGLPDLTSTQALYGTLVHRSIELFHGTVLRAMKNKEPIHLGDDWVEETVRGVASGLKNNGADFSLEQIMRASEEVNSYLEGKAVDWMQRITGSEEDVREITEEAIFFGQLDLVLDKGEAIIDFKTGRKPQEGSERLRTYKDQLLFYRSLMMKEGENPEDKDHILYFTREEETKEVSFTFTASDVAEIRKRSLAIVEKIEEQNFDERTEDLSYCRFCAMNVFCNA